MARLEVQKPATWHTRRPILQHRPSLAGEDRTQPLHALECHPAAAHDAGQRVLGDQHRQAGLLGQQAVEVAQERAAAEDAARKQLALQAERAALAERLAIENGRLRALLELQPALQVRSAAAEVLYEAADPYSRKLFINRGTTQGVVTGAPVINEDGVLGQVTRAFPRSAEVTLLTDRDAAIPIINTRTQQRGAAYGGLEKGSAMELRFVAGNADIKVGDLLQTSGVDGVYPAGLGVAKVAHVERQAEGGFARVTLVPAASSDGVRHVLVLEPLGLQLPPRPEPVPEAVVKTPPKAKKLGAAP